MKAGENIYEAFAREMCANCKNSNECKEELRLRIDNTIKCQMYEKDKKIKGYKRPLNKTAKLEKTVMGLSSSDWR